tara:strand:+ start:260 stop:376 length:117 start_codon:yes stop_codon:yes gene_type:complete
MTLEETMGLAYLQQMKNIMMVDTSQFLTIPCRDGWVAK